jgi:hypothetical protein
MLFLQMISGRSPTHAEIEVGSAKICFPSFPEEKVRKCEILERGKMKRPFPQISFKLFHIQKCTHAVIAWLRRLQIPTTVSYTAQAYFAHQRYLKDEATKLAKATSTEKKSAVSVMLAETTGEATQEDIAAVDEQLLADDSDSRDSLLDQDAAASECSTSEEMLDGVYFFPLIY